MDVAYQELLQLYPRIGKIMDVMYQQLLQRTLTLYIKSFCKSIHP